MTAIFLILAIILAIAAAVSATEPDRVTAVFAVISILCFILGLITQKGAS